MTTYRVRYIPIKNGDQIELGDAGFTGNYGSYYAHTHPHIVIGYKPGPGPKASGWLVVLVDESKKGKGAVQPKARRSREPA